MFIKNYFIRCFQQMNKEQDSIEPDAEKEDPDIITDYCYSFHIEFLKELCISKFKNKKNAKISDWQLFIRYN